MHLKNARDFWAGATFGAGGGLAVWDAFDRGVGSLASPGPGLMPLGLGAVLAGIGLLLLLKALSIEADRGAPVGPVPWRALVCVNVGAAGGLLAVSTAGLAAAAAVTALATALAWRGLGWRAALTAGLAGALVAALVAVGVLGVGLGRPSI